MQLKFLKIKKNFQKKKSEINPSIYWKYLLYITSVLLLAAFVFGSYVFLKTNKDFSNLDEDQSVEIGIVKKQRLEKILEYFSQKEKNSVEILNSPTPIVDPSL